MIGTRDEVNAIANWYENGGHEPPEGWECLGSGSYRDAYLSPSGVVYKIQYAEYGDHDANLCEAAAIERGLTLDFAKEWMPRADIWYTEALSDPVIAMEHIEGECVLSQQEKQAARRIMTLLSGFDDSWGCGESEFNLKRRPNGQPVIIDLGGNGNLNVVMSLAA